MSLPIRSKVVQLQGWFRQHVGNGVAVSLTWDRTGAQTFELIGSHRDQWTTLAIYGRSGGFRAEATGSLLPIEEPELRYTIIGDDIRFASEFTAKGLARLISPADTTVGATPDAAVGFPAIGSLMTLVSMLSFVWQVIHPRVTLQLPGTVECKITLNGDSLTVEMLEPMPGLEVTIGFTFKPKLARVVITQTKIRCEFTGSTIREREFPIE